MSELIGHTPLPTAETSRFGDKNTALSASLITDYVRSANPKEQEKGLKEIFRFCQESDRRALFFGVVSELLTDAQLKAKDHDDKSRIDTYSKLGQHLNTKYLFLSQYGSTSEKKPDWQLHDSTAKKASVLERGTKKVTPASIELADKFLKEGFPQDYGTIIPVLRPEDVAVITQSSFRNYQGISEGDLYVQDEIIRICKKYGIPTGGTHGSHINLLTFVLASNAPIGVNEKILGDNEKAARAMSKGIIDLTMANTFVHESMHRAHGVKVLDIPVSDAIALAGGHFDRIAEQGSLSTSDPKYGEEIYALKEEAKQIAIDKKAIVAVAGAMVMVGSISPEGAFEILFQGGYDVNEAITEHMINPAKAVLLKYFDQNERGNDFQGMLREGIIKGNASHYDNDYSSKLESYFKSLGLNTNKEVLGAFISGQIPLLHLQKLGADTPYFT